MNITSVSSASYSSGGSDASASLERQLQSLEKELQTAQQSKSDPKTKAQEIKDLEEAIRQIKAQIQQQKAQAATGNTTNKAETAASGTTTPMPAQQAASGNAFDKLA